MTGERIQRKLRDGAVREHVYYRCANNHRGPDHPPVRWREADLDDALREDFDAMRMPEEIAGWFRTAIEAAFDDVGSLQAQRKQSLTKRRTEVVQMQDRLLNAYLAGTIDEPTFQAKAADLKRQVAEVEESLDRANAFDPNAPARALATFDFSQASSRRGSVQPRTPGARSWSASV